MSDADRTDQALRLVQWGASDERIEAITGLALPEILAIRAGQATPQGARRPGLTPVSKLWRGLRAS